MLSVNKKRIENERILKEEIESLKKTIKILRTGMADSTDESITHSSRNHSSEKPSTADLIESLRDDMSKRMPHQRINAIKLKVNTKRNMVEASVSSNESFHERLETE